jgi:hypothetical protein
VACYRRLIGRDDCCGLFLFGSAVDAVGLRSEQQELLVALAGAWLDMPAPGLFLFGSAVDAGGLRPQQHPQEPLVALAGARLDMPALGLFLFGSVVDTGGL